MISQSTRELAHLGRNIGKNITALLAGNCVVPLQKQNSQTITSSGILWESVF